jgi:Ca-activated chloride channel homolog
MALKPVTGRKAIVVLSDGVDTGSDISLSKLIEAAQSAEAVVYSIQYSVAIDRISRMVVEAGGHELERLAHETGGVPFPNPGNKTSAVFAWIESNLRSMYVLGFAGPGNAPDYSASAWLLGKFHELNVKTRRSDLFVRSRAGYWASPSQLP